MRTNNTYRTTEYQTSMTFSEFRDAFTYPLLTAVMTHAETFTVSFWQTPRVFPTSEILFALRLTWMVVAERVRTDSRVTIYFDRDGEYISYAIQK